MQVAIDASSLINLSNAGALELALSQPNCEFLVSPMVAGECHAECVAEIMRLRQFRPITLIRDDQIDAEVYLDLLATYALGEGEMECIALCLSSQRMLCCDDRKARYVASELLGKRAVIGSIRLLKWSVNCERTSASQAYEIYLKMKTAGGFLPALDRNWFE